MANKLLLPTNEWTMPQLQAAWKKISTIARKELKMDFYDTEIHIVTYEQMLALYSSHFLPTTYPHWSFGKNYSLQKEAYRRGQSNLPYEVIINTNPTIMYLAENNTAMMQMLTMSHAGCGHGAVFKNNFLFKTHTDPDFILSYMNYANRFIQECENQYSPEEVEILIDACHSLQYHGVFKYPRHHLKKWQLADQHALRVLASAENYNEAHELADFKRTDEDIVQKSAGKELWKMIKNLENELDHNEKMYDLPQENILYFIEKHSLSLQTWEKEIVRIVRKISQYFYPQMQTKLINEGYASFSHYQLMTLLHEKKLLSEGQYLEFLHSHTNVLTQHDHTAINPYKLGYEIFSNIKKICLTPSKDDYYWFPDIAGCKDWCKVVNEAMTNFTDESFILQYLSIDTVEKLQLFSYEDDSEKGHLLITNIQNDENFRDLRKTIAERYAIENIIPHIEITSFNPYNHILKLSTDFKGKKLDEKELERTEKNLIFLTGCDTIMMTN